MDLVEYQLDNSKAPGDTFISEFKDWDLKDNSFIEREAEKKAI